MSEKISTSSIIAIVVGFILISVLLPIGLEAIANMSLPESLDPSIGTLLTSFLPITAIIGVVLAFIPKIKR